MYLKGYLKVYLKNIWRCYISIWRIFEGYLKDIEGVFEGYLKVYLKDIWRIFEGVFEGYLKEYLKVYLKDVWRSIWKIFEGTTSVPLLRLKSLNCRASSEGLRAVRSQVGCNLIQCSYIAMEGCSICKRERERELSVASCCLSVIFSPLLLLQIEWI